MIISEKKWYVFEAWWRNSQNYSYVKNGEWILVKCSEAKWSEMFVLSLIYSYVRSNCM